MTQSGSDLRLKKINDAWAEPVLDYVSKLARRYCLSNEEIDIINTETSIVIAKTAQALQSMIFEEAGPDGLTYEEYQRKLDEYIPRIF